MHQATKARAWANTHGLAVVWSWLGECLQCSPRPDIAEFMGTIAGQCWTIAGQCWIIAGQCWTIPVLLLLLLLLTIIIIINIITGNMITVIAVDGCWIHGGHRHQRRGSCRKNKNTKKMLPLQDYTYVYIYIYMYMYIHMYIYIYNSNDSNLVII